MPSRFTITRAKTTFALPLTPMNPAIVDFKATAAGADVALTWTKQRADEFPSTLVVYSQKPITGRPASGTAYAVGDTIADGITVAFAGGADHAGSPLLVSGLNSGVKYRFAAFPFDATNTYSIGAYSMVTLKDGPPLPIGKFSIPLQAGLNFISLPVDLGVPYGVAQLAAEAGATIVLRYDAVAQKFVAYIPDVPSDEFIIEGGQGYIVNAREAKAIPFEGAVWDNSPAAPPVVATSVASVWAFAVAGQLAVDGQAQGLHLQVTISNPRTGWRADKMLTPTGGRFTVAFADMNRRAVIEAGDTLEIRVTDVADHLLHTVRVPVTDTALREARLILPTLTVRTLPAESNLLLNFPNPFNPETWIPYTLAEANDVTIRIYDAVGHEVRVLSVGFKPAGWYDTKATTAYWDGRNATGGHISSGVYYLVMEAGTSRQIRRSVVLK